jgi:cell wall integrity and stress response component
MRIAQAGVEDPNGYYGDGGFGPKVSRVESRFDGEYLAECRKVNGSIDDFHDYSRRILKVSVFSWSYIRLL